MAKFYATRNSEISAREQEHMKQVRKLAVECMVVLENDGILPLKNKGKIALFGNGARKTIKGGTGSGDVNSRKVVNVEEGLLEAGFEITSTSWIDGYDRVHAEAAKAHWAWIEEESKKTGVPSFALSMSTPLKEPELPMPTDEEFAQMTADTAVYVLSRNSGEGVDRTNTKGDYQLTDSEIAMLNKLSTIYEHLVVLLNVGGVIDTKAIKEIDSLSALVLVSQSGNIGGHAIADMLTGVSIPSGKLTSTWAINYEDYPSSEGFSSNDGDVDDEYYTEGIFTGYRYFDTFNVEPSYCFGYGLNYTSFETLVKEVTGDADEVKVTVEVTNTGTVYSGREVVQVYYSAPQGKLDKPYQELGAFGKTSVLEPGACETMTIVFKTSDMASYSQEKAAWIMEAGDYYIRVGTSSRSTRVAAKLVLDGQVIVEQLKNLFTEEEPVSDMTIGGVPSISYDGEQKEKDTATLINLDSSKFISHSIDYISAYPVLEDKNPQKKVTMDDVLSGKYSIEELTAQLTVEEMANLCCGTSKGLEMMSAVGSSSISVPGAAGDTTGIMEEDRNIRQMILADGPAGLRLVPNFTASEEGVILAQDNPFTSSFEAEEKEKVEGIDYYQYSTAIPIATMLASSWDMDLIETCGRIVGKEMEEMHVTLWLAPGMNNHRNPLCGRNFEYYSEDPLLSGVCAAATTHGVQSIPGIGTTIKHFAANNQENNRFLGCSHVSERALREVYLKSFEIAIKTSQPMSIMSSYNLLNGSHTANHYDLLTAVARDEWGFEGVVMTDWFTTQRMDFIFGVEGKKAKYDISSPSQCVYAGNDLIMPGSDSDINGIIDAVKEGQLDISYLQACSKRILTIASRSHLYEGAKPYMSHFSDLPYVMKVTSVK